MLPVQEHSSVSPAAWCTPHLILVTKMQTEAGWCEQEVSLKGGTLASLCVLRPGAQCDVRCSLASLLHGRGNCEAEGRGHRRPEGGAFWTKRTPLRETYKLAFCKEGTGVRASFTIHSGFSSNLSSRWLVKVGKGAGTLWTFCPAHRSSPLPIRSTKERMCSLEVSSGRALM